MGLARLRYTNALASWDHDELMGSMADDVVIRVAVHDQVMQGRQTADFLFGVLREELDQLLITDEIAEDDKGVVLFDTSLRGQPAQGLNVLHLDEAGLVRDLTVFFRPLRSLQLVAEVIGGRMAERFGLLGDPPGLRLRHE